MTSPTSGPLPVPAVTLGSLPVFKPVATDEIVTIGDRTGIFTPLTAKGGDNTDNLSKIVDVLRGELAEAKSTAAALQEKLDALTAPPRSADNLAEGVQNALDSLADRLGSMTNTTSNFAVREFTLESKVHVDVTALGTIGFQFVKPGETVNAAALSTVTLTVVPIPKPVPDPVEGSGSGGDGTAAGVPAAPRAVTAGVRGADSPVEALGLTAAQADALRRAHVTTAGELARVATRATATAELVSMLGVSREDLGRYVLLAGLLTVPGLEGTAARVLYEAGIHDVAALARSKPATVVSRYAKAAPSVEGAGRWRPKESDAASWIAAAKALTSH
ncbi:MAG TPA: DUF4332 domain-containing protein [Propionibacteriaceae bacterium]|nr:DUF4332 domain-containing protein [Propionibacteriaceae bacterium]